MHIHFKFTLKLTEFIGSLGTEKTLTAERAHRREQPPPENQANRKRIGRKVATSANVAVSTVVFARPGPTGGRVNDAEQTIWLPSCNGILAVRIHLLKSDPELESAS